jgi:hypothetical protein
MDPVAAVETRHRAMRPPCPLISATSAQNDSTGHGGLRGKKRQKLNGIEVRASPTTARLLLK